MDPVTAFGLACNVMQVIDFSLKFVHLCKETHAEGSSKENRTLANTSQYLEEATSEVQQSLDRVSQSRSSLTQSESRLRDLASQCRKSAAKLQLELKKIEKQKGTSVFSTVRTSFKAVRRKDTIEEIRIEMVRYQTVLQTEILVHMRSEQARSILEDESRFNQLDNKLALFIRRLAEGQTKMSDLLRSEEKETRLVVQHEGEHIRDHFDKKFETRELGTSIRTSQQHLLESLRYPQMNERWNSVKDRHEDTYEWIFDDTSERSWSPLLPFLKSEEKLYWVRGKPGSGKSSLMKLVYTDPRTREALEESHPGTHSTLIQFFFWMAGTPLQRDSKGLWCSLLSQLLEEHRHIMLNLQSDLPCLSKKRSIDDWSLKELYDVFGQLVRRIGTPICIFLDGLDEFDPGDGPLEIRRHVDRLTSLPNVKLCVSSRPEPHLEPWLRNNPQLRLEQLTENDIRQYTKDVLRGTSMGDSFEVISEDELSSLQDMVVRKADGVFIWVYYSLNSLVKGLLGGDNWAELTKRLKQLPNEIMALYNHMWNRLNESKVIYRSEAAHYLRFILDWNNFPDHEVCNLIHMTIAGNMDSLRRGVIQNGDHYSIAELIKQCHKTELRLASRCAGLLEIKEWPQDSWYKLRDSTFVKKFKASEVSQLVSYYNKRVEFIHRSAYEFLQGTQEGKDIMVDCQRTEPESAIFCFHVDLIKYLIHQPLDYMMDLIEDFPEEYMRNLPPDEYLETFHLFVRSLQRRLNTEGITCPLDGWDFPLSETISHPLPAIDFIGLAASHGYKPFVRFFIAKGGCGQELSAKYRNYLLVCASHVVRSSSMTPFMTDLDNFAMIRELLDQGADPNVEDQCYSRFHYASRRLCYSIPVFSNFLLGNAWQHMSSPEYSSAWQDTLQKFIHAGVDLKFTVPVEVNANFIHGSRTGVDAFHRFMTAGRPPGGVSMLVEIASADLLKVVLLELSKRGVCDTPNFTVSDWQTRVHYMRKTMYAPPSQKKRRARPATRPTPEYFKVAKQGSEILSVAMTHHWEIYEEDSRSLLEVRMHEVLERSEKIDEQQLYGGLLARGWLVDSSTVSGPGEAFESKVKDESDGLERNDSSPGAAADELAC